MSYSVENINGCTRKLTFNFKDLDLTEEVKVAVLKKQKDVSLKGFRKGKAPLNMVEQMYGPQIENDAVNSFIQNQFYNAVTEEKLKVVGQPTIDNMKYEPGKCVSFDAQVEIFPEVTIKDMDGLTFTKDTVLVEDKEIEDAEKNLLSSKAEMKEVADADRELENGLFAVMNFQGVMKDGTRPENMKGEEFVLELGSNQFIPGFEEKMIGMKKAEKKDLAITFPDDYHAQDLQSAEVTFEVEVLEIKEKKLPEFTDELAKESGYESVEDFKTKTKDALFSQKERAADEKLHQDILNKLIEENSFDLPLALIAQQKTHLKEDVSRTLQQQGFNEQMMEEYFEKWQSDLTEKASFQVSSGLLLDTLATKFEVEANDADVDIKLEEMAKSSGMELEQIKKYYTEDPKIKSNLMYGIREEKTFAKIKEIVTVN